MRLILSFGMLILGLVRTTPSYGQAASLQTSASGSHSVFSLVPIVGATSQLTSRVSAGIYGLYSTDPRVEILCISAPFQWNAHFAVNPIYEFISPPANVNGHYQRESQINIALDAGLTWKRLTLVYHYDRPLFRGRAKKG